MQPGMSRSCSTSCAFRISIGKASLASSCSAARASRESASRACLEVLRPPRPGDDRAGAAECPGEREPAGCDTPSASAFCSRAPRARRRSRSFSRCRYGSGPHRHPRPTGCSSSAPVLAGQPAAGERAEGLVLDPVLLAERDQLSLVAAVEQRVRVLHERGRAELEPLAQVVGTDVARRPRSRSRRARAAPANVANVSSTGVSGSGSWVR